MRWAALLALAACHDPSIVVGGLYEVASLKAIPNRDLDILFVVDNSPSMTEKQASLAQNFPLMMDTLAELDGGLPNLHIGVVTSDMGTTGSNAPDDPAPPVGSGPGACHGKGDDGALQHANAPELAGSFITDLGQPDGTRLQNYTGELRDVFGHIALVGDLGCGFEQHLRSMQKALATPTGFLRPAANLAVVILADEDDCSVADPAFFGNDPQLGPLQSMRCFVQGVKCNPDTPNTPGTYADCGPRTDSTYIDDVAPFVDALVALKGDERRVMVSGVVGNPTPVAVELAAPPGGGSPIPQLAPSCSYTGGSTGMETADPAARLAAFLDHFPGRTQISSICDPDLGGALTQIGDTAKKLVGDPCIDTTHLLDSSPDPGIQPACEVVDVRDAAPDAPVSIPPCVAAGGLDCFELVADVRACPSSTDHLRLSLQRSRAVADDTWTHVRCQLAD
jgi:hypothetical protein